MNSFTEKNKHIIISISVYVILWIITSFYLIHSINADTVSYLSIAKKYYDGNFNDALNACWGPLLSWLVIPSFFLKIEPHIFSRILFGLLSVILFLVIDKFFIKLELQQRIRCFGVYFFILPAVYFSFYRLTPDYLLLVLTLIYILISSEKEFFLKRRLILYSSFVAMLMFFTKSYGMIFFIVFQTILLFFHIFENRKNYKTIIFNYALSIIVFALLITPWIIMISNKYNAFTISTSGTINIRIVNPELNFRHPTIESGFAKPSDNSAVSAHDDPDISMYPEWNPLSNLNYIIGIIFKHLIKFLVFTFLFSPIIIPFNLLLKKRMDKRYWIILLAALIYGLGYTPVYVENRYIWPSMVLLTISGLYIINLLSEKILNNNFKFYTFFILTIISFLPFIFYGFNQQLITTSAYNQAHLISKEFNIKGNIASTNHWGHSLALSYFLNSKFYGTEKLSLNNPLLLSKSKNFNIDYIFDYSPDTIETNGLKFIGKVDSISIYQVINE